MRHLIVNSSTIVVSILTIILSGSLSATQVRAQEPVLYWLSDQQILRMDLASRDVEAAVQRENEIRSFTLDPRARELYWSELGEEGWYILRSGVDGSEPDTLVSSSAAVTSNCSFPLSIAVDGLDGKLYWTMSVKGIPDGICRADLDGGDIRQIIRAGNTSGIALDPIERKLYFSKPQGDILRADLDGSGVETLAKVDRPDVILDITLDPVRRKIYWYQKAGVTRANIDGTDRVPIIAEEVYHLAMDEQAGRLYWSGPSGVHRGSVDGTEAELLVDGGGGSPLALLYPESTAPQR